jgi:hypothetical protein
MLSNNQSSLPTITIVCFLVYKQVCFLSSLASPRRNTLSGPPVGRSACPAAAPQKRGGGCQKLKGYNPWQRNHSPELHHRPKRLSAADLGFINNGPGKDNVPDEEEIRLAFVLPVSLHTRFKSICATRRIKMADELRLFVERRTAELERG